MYTYLLRPTYCPPANPEDTANDKLVMMMTMMMSDYDDFLSCFVSVSSCLLQMSVK